MFLKGQSSKLFSARRPGYTSADSQAERRDARISELDTAHNLEVKRLSVLVNKAQGKLWGNKQTEKK